MGIKVSILIPCYNAEKWISQCIKSALNQTYKNKEVIVIDDGSSDNSLDIIKSFGDRIQWQTQNNQGGNVTRNHLLELSNGEWLQYLDSDDYLLPNKIEQQVDFLQLNPTADIIYSPSIYEYTYNDNTSTQELFQIPEPHDPWVLLARWFLPQTGSPLWRKQAVVDVGNWKVDQPCCQEHELYFRLLKSNKEFLYFGASGSIYRQWSEETLCKKNKPEVFRQRMLIENLIEEYLLKTEQLNSARKTAINQARFECARLIWQFDKNWAEKIMNLVVTTDNSFKPMGDAAPKLYQFMYSMFGFVSAETIADYTRVLKRK